MPVRAKFKVNEITSRDYGTTVKLNPVYSTDPNHENKSFADATPSGDITLQINKGRPAANAFELGKEYYVDFTPAETPAPATT